MDLKLINASIFGNKKELNLKIFKFILMTWIEKWFSE